MKVETIKKPLKEEATPKKGPLRRPLGISKEEWESGFKDYMETLANDPSAKDTYKKMTQGD